MRPLPKEQLSKKVIPLWRIKALFEMLLLGIVPVVYGIFVFYFQFPLWLLWFLGSIFIFIAIINIFFVPSIRFNRWRYEVLGEEVDFQSGVVVVRRTLIPMLRIQHVDTEQGPLQRRFGLATLSISTAATIHQIPGLTLEVADDLRDKISNFVSVADDHE